MERNFTTVTVAVTVAVFTLLFSVTAARFSDLPRVQTNCGSNSLPEPVTEASNLAILTTETTRSRSDGADHVKKPENDRIFRVDLTPRSDFARFHAINRRFFDEHRPYRRFQNPFVNRNEAISTGETGKSDARKFHRRGAPSRFMKYKHDYGHHHRHQHQHHRIRHNTKDVSMPKHKFVSEKMKSLVHEHKEKEETRQHEASFMKSIRKFLKHSFE